MLKLLQIPLFCSYAKPAAFGRLCVETKCMTQLEVLGIPAAFGRLCVETSQGARGIDVYYSSRLRAAVC